MGSILLLLVRCLFNVSISHILIRDVECLRDIDLEDEALRLAIRGPSALSMRFARSLAGQEYGRVMGWGEKPDVAVSYKNETGQYRGNPSVV